MNTDNETFKSFEIARYILTLKWSSEIIFLLFIEQYSH